MLIVTETGEAVNAHHVVRFFLHISAEEEAVRYRLILQIANRQKVIAATVSDEVKAQLLFRDVVRHWIRGQACVEINACLKRIERGEPEGCERKEECL